MSLKKLIISGTRLAAFLFSFVIISSGQCFTAYASDNDISITLEVNTDDSISYQPGASIPYEAIINNILDPAWVRINISLSQEGIESSFDDSWLNILDNWVKRGDYYYYTLRVESGSSLTAIDGIQLPDLNSSSRDSYISITLYADAVLYSSYDPDFDSDDPWANASDIYSVSYSSGSGSSSGSSSKKDTVYSSIYIYDSPSSSGKISTGYWEKVGILPDQWKYHDAYGNYARNGWIYVYNPYSVSGNSYGWFHFDDSCIMSFGWYKANESVWYYTHEVSDGDLGLLMTGWLDDITDGRLYYSDPVTGIMLTGWQVIDSRYYYFASMDDIPEQTWFWNTSFGKWLYERLGFRSYGSMYVDEITPDGTLVGPEGYVPE